MIFLCCYTIYQQMFIDVLSKLKQMLMDDDDDGGAGKGQQLNKPCNKAPTINNVTPWHSKLLHNSAPDHHD